MSRAPSSRMRDSQKTLVTASSDGTPIAFDRIGSGPPLILVDGALVYRDVGPTRALAEVLASHFTVFTYDRRGRGASGDTPPYAVKREVEDIEALAREAGRHRTEAYPPRQRDAGAHEHSAERAVPDSPGANAHRQAEGGRAGTDHILRKLRPVRTPRWPGRPQSCTARLAGSRRRRGRQSHSAVAAGARCRRRRRRCTIRGERCR